MLKTISDYVKMAERVVDFAKITWTSQAPMGWRSLVGGFLGDKSIAVYDDAEGHNSVMLGRVEVTLYTNKITLPLTDTHALGEELKELVRVLDKFVNANFQENAK